MLMPIQFKSSSYQARPWRAEVGCAWWLLCHPSPNVRSATHQLLVESSRVLKRREPQRCVAEFTSQVRVQAPGRAEEDAPEHVRDAAEGEQHEADDDVRRPVPVREPARGTRSRDEVGHVALQDRSASWCRPSPWRIQPMCAHHVPSRGVCGSPS